MKQNSWWISSTTLATVALIGAVRCSSVPSNAPVEFTQANEEINKAKSDGVDEFFPKTIERASREYDKAVELYSQSEKYVDPSTQAQKRNESVEQARRSASIVTNARRALRTTKSWDDDIDNFTRSGVAPSEEAGTSRSSSVKDSQETSSISLPAGQTQTIAKFALDSATLDTPAEARVSEAARLMQDNPGLLAELIPFTDPTGTASHNKTLAMNRAEAVLASMRADGIDARRISVRFPDVSEESASSRAEGRELRRVDVHFVAGPQTVQD